MSKIARGYSFDVRRMNHTLHFGGWQVDLGQPVTGADTLSNWHWRELTSTDLALEALTEFEKRLLAVIEARVSCEVPDWAEGPFRGGVYDPVMDDDVKVNLLPLQETGVLQYRKVISD